MIKSLISSIRNRRSIRNFNATDIPNEIIQELLVSAMHAPSPKNHQPWKFIVCKNEIKNSISEILCKKLSQPTHNEKFHLLGLETAKIIADAPVIVLVCYDKKCQENRGNDGSMWNLNCRQNESCDILSIGAAVQNLLIEAHNLGISSLWIADILYAYDEILTLLECEDTVVSAIVLGYSNDVPTIPTRDFDKISWL